MSSIKISAAARGGRPLASLPVLICFVLGLSACVSGLGGAGKDAAPDMGGSVKRVAYGVSLQVPEDWQVGPSLEPDGASREDLEARVRSGQPVMILGISRPAEQPRQVDALIKVYVADSARFFPPLQEVATRSQEELDKLAATLMRQRNEASVKKTGKPDTLEMRFTRETVDGLSTLLYRGLGEGPDGKVRFQFWYVYLVNGMGIAVDAMGDAGSPGMDSLLEAVVRSLRVQADAP
ncbi:MAG: hypothetical protein LBO77_01690 [Desulfovibrio sp.]|jgi:hypothetical protein|nr:hypothetical protein [Desulfovibrio sp.]